jgi:neutral ceramidase
MAPVIRAGVARAVITPPVGITHAHWGAQTHTRATGVDMDMWATALVVGDGATEVAIVDCDAIGYPTAIVNDIRREISALTGIPEARVRLSVSHTHSGGNVTPAWYDEGKEMIAPYVAALPNRIAGAVWEAQRTAVPARIAVGKGHSDIGINRRLWLEDQHRIVLGRNYAGFADHEMQVARIDDENEQPIAVIVSYSCHPTIMAQGNSRITPDYPGVLRRAVEGVVGCKCLFLQGSPGDVHPKQTYSSRKEDYHLVGRLLGLEAAKVALGLQTVPRNERLVEIVESGAELCMYSDDPAGEPDATLKVIERAISLPLKQMPTVEASDVEYRQHVTAVAEARERGDAAGVSKASYQAKRAGMRANMARQYSGKDKVDLSMLGIRIGSLALVSLPGEPFSRIGAGIRAQSPFAVTMFSGYSNGSFSYIPMREDYGPAGYGVWNSPLAAGAGEQLIEEAVALLKELA